MPPGTAFFFSRTERPAGFFMLKKNNFMPISKVYNMDCMEYMRSMPDKFFELAVVDPPYGGKFPDMGWKKIW